MRLQKRIAAKIFKVGKSKVWIDPSKINEVKKAITKRDVANLIKKGYIKKKYKIPEYPFKEEKKRVRKGGKYSTLSKKRRWIITIRSLRKFIKTLKNEGKIDSQTFKKLYKWCSSGMFKSRSHVLTFLKQRKLIKKE